MKRSKVTKHSLDYTFTKVEPKSLIHSVYVPTTVQLSGEVQIVQNSSMKPNLRSLFESKDVILLPSPDFRERSRNFAFFRLPMPRKKSKLPSSAQVLLMQISAETQYNT